MEMGGGGSIMIFCNTKSSCSFVHEQLKLEGIDHGSCPLVAAVSVGVAAVIVVVKPAVVSFALGFPFHPLPFPLILTQKDLITASIHGDLRKEERFVQVRVGDACALFALQNHSCVDVFMSGQGNGWDCVGWVEGDVVWRLAQGERQRGRQSSLWNVWTRRTV